MSILIDSDVLIEVMRQRDPEIMKKWLHLAASSEPVLCTPISVCELWHGARPREAKAIQALFDTMLCVPLNDSIGHLAGQYMSHYTKSHGLELPDAFVAAAANQTGAQLWTRNRKHYPMKDLTFF